MKRIYVSLTTKDSISKAIKALEDYRSEIINKTELLVSRLMDVGIESGIANSGAYKGMIVFQKEIRDAEDGVEGVLVATDGQKIIREWKYKGGIKQAEVSPLLMASFGSGWLAHVMSTGDYRSNEMGVGQGTFPGQTHAFDKDGWWWETPDGEKHHSIGEAPTYPVHSALFTMMFEVDRIAKEVFSGK